jgi:hypothetical protein
MDEFLDSRIRVGDIVRFAPSGESVWCGTPGRWKVIHICGDWETIVIGRVDEFGSLTWDRNNCVAVPICNLVPE